MPLRERSAEENWWLGRCGAREVLVLAWPLVISTGSWALMHFCDRTFLFWHSTAAVAASLQGGTMHWLLVCLPLGLAGYVNVFVAQYHGAREHHQVGPAVWQGMWLGGICTLPLLAVIPVSRHFFTALGHASEAAGLEAAYFNALAPGAGAAVISAAQAAYFTGRGFTRPVMFVDLAVNLLNAGLDYLLIFGYAGFPAWGIAGAGIATSISQWVRVAAFAGLMAYSHERRECGLGRFAWNFSLMRRLLVFGTPSALQMLLEVAAFSCFLLFVGQLDSQAIAATTLAFNINVLAFVPLIGLGTAVSTLVGQQLGDNRPDLAARATWTAFALALLYSLFWTIAYVALPNVLLRGYELGAPAGEFAPLHERLVVLLRFVAAYMLFDAMNVVFSHAIKGAGDTRFVLLTSLLTCPLPALGSYFGVRWWGFGLYGCWTVVSSWICLLGIIYLARFLGGKWRQMRVIGPLPD